ncbi:thioredoxin-like 3-3 [Selaginella moellendorffii]|uniref:thioredoxin-like 3-3 n=1 Tax=Selaginella moellendorffii TaxID=88036 RepID=UPI000D1C2A39|nr:thioredoxin-like 3-3 [Selaginella moellendorffii]|eukprot:XP_024518113.1 thioredoxin-like 3-3 [Selaginella moellendorffii]
MAAAEGSGAAAAPSSLDGVGGDSLPVNFHGNLVSARNNEQFKSLLDRAKASKKTVSLCVMCKQMLPTFCNLSNEYPRSLFIYADIDECPDETKDVRYTPTFRFYSNGDKVDEFYGVGAQRLRDRVWLHS